MFAVVSSAVAQGAAEQRFPDVLEVKVRAVSQDVFDFDATISSLYDTPSRYGDGCRRPSASW
jgi:hypothetical protein